MRLRQIERDLAAHALLRRRQRKRQRLQQTRHQRRFVAQLAARHGRRRTRAALVMRALQRHLLRQQFFELDPHPRRMRAVDQRVFIGLHARMMQRAHRVHQRRHAERLHISLRDRLGQQLRQRGARQRVVDRFAQIRLRHARGARIHRRQRLRQRRVFVDHAHRRMHHLHAEETAAHVAAHAQPRADRHLLDLRAVEIQKAQHEFVAGVVAQFHQQLAARAIGDLVVEHHAFGLRDAARQQMPDRRQRGLVFVAHRQMQHQIDVARETEFGELVDGFGRGLGAGFGSRLPGGFARGFAGRLVAEWVNHFTFTRGVVALRRDATRRGRSRSGRRCFAPRDAALRLGAHFIGSGGQSAFGQRHGLLRKYNIGCQRCRRHTARGLAGRSGVPQS